jgi:hypothetical protein
MTTPRRRALVSLAAALTLAASLSGCAGAHSGGAVAPAPVDGPQLAVRFDNDARSYVHVYLIGEQRQWLLGRVEPGAKATLRIPEDALAELAGSMRLAVLAGERVTMQAAAAPHATVTIPEPAAAILSQRWTFSQAPGNGQLTALPLGRARADLGSP